MRRKRSKLWPWWSVGLLATLFGISIPPPANGEPSCSLAEDETSIVCQMRTLNSQNSSRFSGEPDLASIRVRCSDVFFYESFLKTNHFGYLPNMINLELEFCKIRKVPSLAFSGLSNLESLTICTHNSEWSAMMMELEKDAFTGLNHLKQLNLTQNNLWTLPASVFCSLDSLESLNLSRNYLQDVMDLGFASQDLRSCRLPLETLDLSHNSLTIVPTTAFGQLTRLKTLYLNGNNLNILEDEAFTGLETLQKLDLANNELVALPPDTFREMKHLRELYLQNNSLTALAPGIFSNLEGLLLLNLSRNDITNDWLNSDAFSALHQLRVLDLSHNQLTRLDSNLFRGMSSLKILNLEHNRILSVEANTFQHQAHHLQILYLSYNRLENLHPKAIHSLPFLNSLSLDHNQLRSLHRNALKNCSTLQDLALHNNRLQDIPKSVRSLPLLRTLDLGGNGIKVVKNDSLKGLSHLYGLRLAENGLEHIHVDAFTSVPNLQVLNLANNNIEKENLHENVLFPLTELRVLRLDKNRLVDINGLLQAQSELLWLNVSFNRLQWFDYASIPKSVNWLDLHENQLEDLGNYFALKTGFSLDTLDASHNRISRIGPLSIVDSLRTVFLNGNQITTIEANSFSENANLRRVDLSENEIRHLQISALSVYMESSSSSSASSTSDQLSSSAKSSSSLGGTDSSKSNVNSRDGKNSFEGDQGERADRANNVHFDHQAEFFLAGNPLLCDCEMEWLQKINQVSLKRGYPRVMDLDNIHCELNNKHPNQSVQTQVPILSVRPEEFVCEYQAHCFALCMCCDFFACDCRMQCPGGCSCFHDSAWSSNIIQCSMRGHLEIPPLIPMDATTIYLDGNNFTGTLESQAFIGRKRVLALYLNQSQIEAINNQTFNGLTELEVLHLEDNFIGRLEGYEFGNLTSLLELHLQNNRLIFIHDQSFSSLVSLEVLHLHGNLLKTYPLWSLQILPQLAHVSLSENPWSCECEFVQQFQEFARSSRVIADMHLVQCYTDNQKVYLNQNVTCSDALAVTSSDSNSNSSGAVSLGDNHGLMNIIPVLVGIIALCVMIVCSSLVIFVFRTPLRVWLHSKYGIRVLEPCRKSSQDKPYDAFLSYSLKDEDFIQQILVPHLEQSEPGYKLCLQHRDLPNTSSISDTFPSVAQLCAKHVLLVSRAYLESEWIHIKFALQDSPKLLFKPVIILLEELTSLDLAAAPEFNLLLKTVVVLRWNEAGFWNKLRYFLPDSYSKYKSNIISPGAIASPSSLHCSKASPRTNHPSSSLVQSSDWYDAVITSNDSSTSTRSTIMGGSPRDQSGSSTVPVQVLANPMMMENWAPSEGSESAYSWNDHTYQTIPHSQDSSGQNQTRQNSSNNPPPHHHHHQQLPTGRQIYHNLDDSEHLGSVDVMLPNGQMVPATLVRNPMGKIVPVVQVDSVSPRHNTHHTNHRPPTDLEEKQPLRHQEVTFPRTVVYRHQNQTQFGPSSGGHLV